MNYASTIAFPHPQWPTLDSGWVKVWTLLVILSLVSQPLLLILPAPTFPSITSSGELTAAPSNIGATPTQAAPTVRPYTLPAELVDQPEVVALRTAESATFDLGDGNFARLQGTTPLHYQDQAGQWQPIDPAFVKTALGWVNSTNTIRTALHPKSSAATISANRLGVRWQPAGLELVTLAGTPRSLATPNNRAQATALNDRTAIRLHNSWSLATLTDQWQSSPGRVEYTMRLDELPQQRWWQATPDALDLVVKLTLQPATTLLINGQVVDLSTVVTTQGALTLRGADGSEMSLQPPVSYEQENQDARVAATYVVTGLPEAGKFELRVRTPWSWLAAPERQFPVIIDPIFQMRRPWLAAEAIYTPSTPGAPYTYDQTHYVSDELYLGRNTANAYRAALRFDLPLMPPGTQIDRAWLHVVPSDYKRVSKYFTSNLGGLVGEVSLYAIQNENWINGGEPAVNLNEPLAPASQLLAYSAGQTTHAGIKWDVTNLAKGWLPIYGGLAPTNHGLLLRLKHEFCDPNGVIFLPETLFCGGFRFDMATDAWALHPDLENTQVNGTPDEPLLMNSETGGIRLVIFYHNDGILTKNTPLTYEIAGNQLPQGADKNPPYYYADHLHNVAKPPAEWQAVVARSRSQPTGDFPPTQPGVNNSYRIGLSGAMNLDLRSVNDSFSVAKAPAATDQVSYLLLNGRGAASPLFQERLPLRTTFTPDPEAGLSNMMGYDIRLVGENGTITAPLNIKQTVNYTFDSADPLALWNLQLPTGSNTSVRISITGDGTRPESYVQQYAKLFEAKIVRSTSQGEIRTSAFDDKTAGPKAWTLNATMATSADLDNVQAGQHALAIRYSGPQITAYDVEECGAEFCDTTQLPIRYTLTVEVLACPAGSIATNGGQCQKVVCPNTTSLVANYRETDDYGLWSNTGWSGSNESVPVGSVIGDTAPLLGPRKAGLVFRAMTVAAIGGKITYNKGTGAITVSSDQNNEAYPAKIRLIQCPTPSTSTPAFTSSFPVFDGKLSHPHPQLGDGLRAEPAGSGQIKADPWPLSDRQGGDLEQETLVITPASPASPTASTAIGSARLRRAVGQGPVINLRFQTGWAFTAAGWPSLTSTITQAPNNPAPPALASLSLSIGTQLELDTTPADGATARTFTAVRAKAGTITQPAALGGASKPLQLVILPRDSAMPVVDVLCPASCLDLRGPNDVANGQLDRAWAMPDVHTNVDANTVMMKAAGVMELYSTDHPTLREGSNSALTKEFSFDAYKATVSLDFTQCGGTGPDVWVITGETSMALPNIGAAATGGLIAAGFTLCETNLRGVKFNFESPVGLPIGNSGLFLTGVRGAVDIYPDYTKITVGLNFQAAPGGDGGIFKAYGEVTIDTRGLFEFAGGGKVLGVVNADGRLWVAWNPLDTGFEVNVRLGSWFRGFARAHLWQGQGWQNRYSWLPDNNEMHFAGEIGATITIEESAVMWLVPPGDIEIGIEVAFGQFCTNNSCTQYEWGIKGKVIIAGFDVGIYYGFDKGLDFILGNDDHLLIDEYGALITAASTSAGLKIGVAPQKVAGEALIPFTVSTNAEQILVGLSWQAGTPTLSLINPDGVEINVDTIASHNGQSDGNANITILTLQQPKAGAWQAKLSKLSGAGVEHYRFLYFANKGAPGPVGNHGHFLAPAQANEAGTNGYTITWQAPADTPAQATISLFYERTQSNADALSETGYITGNLLIGAPIVQNLPFTTGVYQWNTTGLRNGEYRIRAVVDDGVNELPSGQISIPNDMCQADPSGLPSARAFDPNRFPGTVNFTAAGTVLINDVTPPVTPTGIMATAADSAILLKWNGAAEPDVTGYLVRWGKRSQANPQIFVVENQKLVAAPDGEQPLVYVGAVDNGKEYGVDVTALDVNGNASPQSAAIFVTPSGASNPVPLQPQHLSLVSKTGDSATVTWQANPAGAAPASYRVTYLQLDHLAPAAYRDVTSTSTTLSDLTPSATYDIQVAARNSDGWSSVTTDRLRVVITNGVDSDGDGLPDDWATAHGVSGGTVDSDGDGLTNAVELAQGTDPADQDSDNDDASDGEEAQAQSDALDSSSYSGMLTQPRLALERNNLTFTAKLQAGGEAAPQVIGWQNVGGGTLQLQASSSQNWLQPTVVNDKVQVALNTSGLPHGFHSGVIRLSAAPGSDPLIGLESQGAGCIRVNAWVLPADDDTSSGPGLDKVLYLPLINR